MFGSSSIALDGNGDYLTLPDSDDWAFGAGDFTIDGWFFFNDVSVEHPLVSQYYENKDMAWLIDYAGDNVFFFYSIDGTTSLRKTFFWKPTINNWYHIAMVRSGNDLKLYVNGTQIGGAIDLTGVTIHDSAAPLTIGTYRQPNGNYQFFNNGSIDELRISKGIARWTSDFTPPDSGYDNLLYKTTGSITSDVIELNATALKSISWNESLPAGTDITIQTRTGDTLNPDDGTWSTWSDTLTDPLGSTITSPAARFMQYRVNMTTCDPSKTPQLTGNPIIRYMKESSVEDGPEYIKVTKDSLTYKYDKDGAFIELIDDKGIRYFYDDSNRLVKVSGDNENYIYEYSGDSTVTKMAIEKMLDITSNPLNFNISNLSLSDDIELKSYADLLTPVNPNYYKIPDIGSGSDGAKHVTADETLSAGTYNYTSLTIDAGKTLTFAPGATIKCLGTITVNGTLTGADLNISAHTVTISASGSLSGLGQHISANTINNSGNMQTLIGDVLPASYNVYQRGGTLSRSSTQEISFPACTISKLVYDLSATANTDGYSCGPSRYSYCAIYVNYSDTGWTLLYSSNGSSSASLNNTITGSWDSVIGIRAYVISTAHADHDCRVTGNINTLKAYVDPECDYINSAGNVPASTDTSDYTNALKYYINGWIGAGGVRADIASQIAGSPSLLDDLYHGDRIFEPNGTLTSDPMAIYATDLGYILADVDTPAGTSVRFMTRTGASANINDGSWSGWLDAAKDATGYKIDSPVNKYVQYQAILETADITETPSINSNGEYAIKLSSSYDTVFDATAPPGDLPFKEYLTFTTPELPITPQTDELKIDSNQFSDLPAEIENLLLPDTAVIQTKSFKEDENDITVETTKDNKLTYYVNGKVQATYQKHADNHLELLMEYSYDTEGNLSSVNLPSARNSIDTQILAARQQIAAERASYLRTLAEQKGLAYTQIRDQIQDIRDDINTSRASLPPLYQQVTKQRWVGWWIFGWYETYTETVEVPGVRDAINQLNEQEQQLNDAEANAYAELDGEVSVAEQRLIDDEEAALAQVAEQEKLFQDQIVKEEATPVILDCYRSVLGRDPDEAETDAWLSTVDYDSKIDANALRNALMSSEERRDQEIFVESLKNSVRTSLYDYLDLDEAGRESFLSTLGLSAADAVRFGTGDADAILSLLDKQNIHFGRSAFVALGTILTNNGITYNFEDIALKTILVDIFTGSLNQFSEGTLLELSMYALSKTASTYGVTLNNTRLNFDDLRGLAQTVDFGVIVHLKNNHYVVVTNIAADDKVTYIENNRGQNGYTWTVSKEDFERGWTGYAMIRGLTQSVDDGVNGSDPLSDLIQSKKISDDVAMRIKGSCLPFLWPLIMGIVNLIGAFATAAVAAISYVVGTISLVLAPIIEGVGAMMAGLGNFMGAMGTQIFGAISFVGESLLPGIGGWIGGIGSWIGGIGTAIGNGFGLGSVISATGFNITGLGFALAKTVVLTALSIGVSKGLEVLGVNSSIAGLLTSFVTGGVGGLFNNSFSVLSFITGGIQGLAIQGVSELAPRLGIDPMLSNVISMTAGAFIGAVGNNISSETGLFDFENFSASIGERIMPNISSELAYFGVTKAGELLGVDPRISYGVSSFASSLIGNTLSGADIATSFSRAINSSIVSVGVNLLEGVDPAFSAIRSTGLMGALENILNEQGLFNGIFGILDRVASSAFNAAGEIVGGIFGGAKTFVELVTETGPLAAMNNALNSLFTRQTVETVVAQGGMEVVLAKPSNQVVLLDGRPAQEIAITNDSSIFLNESGEIISIKEKGITATGSFIWTQNNGLQLKSGTVEGSIETGGYSIWADIEDGKAKDIKSWSINGEAIEINPEKPNTPIEINSVSNSPSEFNFLLMNAVLSFANTFVYKINQETVKSIEQKVNVISAGSLFNDTNKFLYALANGIGNTMGEGVAPDYIYNLEDDLKEKSNNNITDNDMCPVALFNPTFNFLPEGINKGIDVLKWVLESQTTAKNSLVNQATIELAEHYIQNISDWNRPVVGMGYSGGLMPLAEAVSKSLYNVKTFVGFGAATSYIKPGIVPTLIWQLISAATSNNLLAAAAMLGYSIINRDQLMDIVKTKMREIVQQSNLSGETFPFSLGAKTDLFVNVWGTKDVLYECGIAGYKDSFCGVKQIYNIEIIGADHFQYMEGVDANSIPYWNRVVAEYCARLIINSDTKEKLEEFLKNPVNCAHLNTERNVWEIELPGCEAFR
jgi:hypothetical protein